MSRITNNFDALYDAQTRATGDVITASINGGEDLDCIPSAGNADLIQLDGGSGMSGGYTLQMRKSDFDTPPEKGQSVTVSCYDDDALELTSDPEEAGGIYTLRVGDLSNG